ncbi:hypothetical protein [Epilithonimonas arachidiradicis]|uniref:HK97 family phage prohead protease n=1 Tax=Epilithonimonas arachidiradicis TaxID=1617282 RepID=A0A420DE06_9FLAO|nr:hypothetical protein [Epilithonimonas arachidiradicis]RKE90013.1 hypothetical protein BXY58_0598 [Epilithonimonas arachidiradicis]GGG47090.1 hypothetical protein GCM10007332_05730 [Epilithonimonas arachidiradicis]
MEYKFIVNTENVNSYGYRIITEGIETTQYERNPVVLFMHQRPDYKPTGDEVIGRARLAKEGDQLLAYITFDTENDFAAKIEKKVKGDFIRMCSMYADVIEASSDPALAMPGQKYETITKCKLIEISIVDIGGNDDAIRLSSGGSTPKIKLLNQKKIIMSELKTIALALGKPADTSESELLNTVTELKLAKTNAENKASEWEGKYVALQKSEATTIVNKAVKLGLIPEDLAEGQISLFEKDFEGQKVKLSKLIEEKEESDVKDGTNAAIQAVVLAGGKKTPVNTGGEESFDYLQKNDPVKLAKIRAEEPVKYAQLSAAYGQGVRWTPAQK